MKKLACLLLCGLSWTAWARPATSLEELRAIDRRGQTWKTSVTPPRDNARWLADLTPEAFTLENASLLKGQWYTGAKAGVAHVKLPESCNEHVLRLDLEASIYQGAVRLESGGQEVLAYTLDHSQAGVGRSLDQKVNVNIAKNGELRWFLSPNSALKVRRIRVYQLK